ncbi:MAG: hypothetical protein JJE17_05775 [Peptostreptococcaceae bacterium]|nr:hypothetical protein [Peptostreptococcaceae bacterium]
MKIGSPSEIYEIILSEINNLIHSLKTETTDDEIRKSQEDAQKQLAGIHRELNSVIESLQLNAEWDVFNIAFYGETNAGKSTLIETLRILLREPTKEKEREEFKKINDSIQNIQNQLNRSKNLLEQMIKDYQLRIIEIEENIKSINFEQEDNENQNAKLNENIHDIENQIKIKRKSSITNFFRALLGILKEQQEHRMYVEKISNHKSNIIFLNNEKSELEKLNVLIQEEWDTKAKSTKVSEEILENEIIQISGGLLEYCDGAIIGDGHSDCTRKVTTYQFECYGQKFALLDLPGIEGKEDLVLNEIKDAVQKAHAVFYITSKPTPPQTGNKHSEGTLEKIKKHLGQQTEVYSIFNKRVKNYQQLQPGLINDDEKESLKELDTIMRNRLGDQYEKHVVLSAYPAFLSIANCSQNNFEKSQKKFFEKFDSPGNLLQASLVENFSDWITMELVKNCKAKIKRSNYKKASVALTQTSNELNEIHKGLYNLEKKIIKTKKATDNQLDDAAEILKQQLDSDAYKAVDDFRTLIRKNIYSDIDKELNNDEFKSVFECRTNEAINILGISLEKNFDRTMNEFKNDVASIVETYHRYESELLNAYKNSSKFDFDFTSDIDIKSGINLPSTILSVITAIGGVILCFMSPAGWALLALSILGGAISIGKEVLGVLDHKYRASQQKKVSDDNIEEMGNKILESILVNLKDAEDPLQEGISGIKDELLKSINHIKSMNQVFCSAAAKFELLITTVEEEGVN